MLQGPLRSLLVVRVFLFLLLIKAGVMAFHASGYVTVSDEKGTLVLNLKDPVTYLYLLLDSWT